MRKQLSFRPLIVPLSILILACSSTTDSEYYTSEPAWTADPDRIYFTGTLAENGYPVANPASAWPYSVVAAPQTAAPDSLTPPSEIFPQGAPERAVCELGYRGCSSDVFWSEYVLPSAQKNTPDWIAGELAGWHRVRDEDTYTYGTSDRRGRIRFGYEDGGAGWYAHGPAQSYDLNGRLASEGTYRLGVAYGPWRYFGADGSLQIGPQQGGSRVGLWGTFNSGKLTELVEHRPEQALQLTYEFNDQGQLKAEFTKQRYRLSEYDTSEFARHGPYRIWNAHGRLLERGEYYAGKLHGQVFHWNDEMSGRLEISNFNNGIHTGWQCIYHIDGWRWIASQYKPETDGPSQPNGKSIEWLKDGTLFAQRRFQHGILHGQANTYGPGGYVASEMHYEHGNLQGRYVEFWPDRQVKVAGQFELNREVGDWLKYSNNGSLVQFTKYSEEGDFLLDAERVFESEDELKGAEQELGMMQGKWRAWYDREHEQASWEASFFDNLTDGDSVAWHTNGQVAAKGEYLIGAKVGDWEYWHINGQKSAEEHYDDLGTPIGVWKRWNEHGELIDETNYDK